MTTKHYCDVCEKEVENGYTVEWQDDIQDESGWLVAQKIPDRTSKIVCESCWPGEDRWFDALEMLVS